MTDLPETISDTEGLGRAIFDTQKAARAARDGAIHPNVFREKDGVRELSVDRLSYGSHLEIAKFHDRERGRTCLGWGSVTGEIARQNGRSVNPDPIKPDNLFHALIVLPTLDDEARDTQQEHAVELATAATWVPRPPEPVSSHPQPG
jgi:hypothetical protein